MRESMTVDGLLARAREAYEALASLAADVDEEWLYIEDLGAAWAARLDEVAAIRGAELAGPGAAEAIERLCDEVGRIRDPHRAIDWLSTFPQVALIALAEPP